MQPDFTFIIDLFVLHPTVHPQIYTLRHTQVRNPPGQGHILIHFSSSVTIWKKVIKNCFMND